MDVPSKPQLSLFTIEVYDPVPIFPVFTTAHAEELAIGDYPVLDIQFSSNNQYWLILKQEDGVSYGSPKNAWEQRIHEGNVRCIYNGEELAVSRLSELLACMQVD